MKVQKDVDRMLKLLREKIRDRGYTQLRVQEALGWGRTYISQLFRKQKSLRYDQILSILDVIGIDAGEYFAEFYGIPFPGKEETYGFGYPARNWIPPTYGVDPLAFEELRAQMSTLKRLLVEKGVLEAAELEAAMTPPPSDG